MTTKRRRGLDLLFVVLGTGVVAGAIVLVVHLATSRSHGHSKTAENADAAAPTHDLRLVPVEAYIRTYLNLFGGLAPLEVQARARGAENIFDTWADYVSVLGLPDYRTDVPRQTQSNALMVATFERMGIALCDRAVERDLKAKDKPAKEKRVVFAFDLPPAGKLDAAGFAERFDVLHRTFLGYPANLAPTARTERFWELYQATVKDQQAPGTKSKFSPDESGWAAVCYGLVRHPEFQLY